MWLQQEKINQKFLCYFFSRPFQVGVLIKQYDWFNLVKRVT